MTSKFGYSIYDVMQSRGGVQAIIVSMDAWGCKMLIENGLTDSEYVNYPWSAIAFGQFHTVG